METLKNKIVSRFKAFIEYPAIDIIGWAVTRILIGLVSLSVLIIVAGAIIIGIVWVVTHFHIFFQWLAAGLIVLVALIMACCLLLMIGNEVYDKIKEWHGR